MKVLIVASLLISIAGIHADNSVKSGFQTTFFDDFDGQQGSAPSSANWLIDLGTSYPGAAPHWGNSEVETYTADPSNLAITAEQTLGITPVLSSTGNWTSGRIETVRTDFLCQEGGKLYIEAKLKLGTLPESQSQGIWPAFWALGSQYRGNYANWPMVSEWDFMENVNGLPRMYTTIHCGTSPGGPCNEVTGIGSNTGFSMGQWHTVGFQVDRTMTGAGSIGTWLDETLTWYLDDQLVFTVTGATVNDQSAWIELAQEDHFLLLNVAVGGAFPNAIAAPASTPTSATVGGSVVMEVDYVGVWNSV